MSGETVEMTESGSVDSALVWTDKPEVEYFRAMMNDRIEGRMASGMSSGDSLLGESTLHDILDDQQTMSDTRSSLRRSRREVDHLNGVETSGLSLNENDTVENIRTHDGPSREAVDVAFEVGTLETPPDIPPRVDPATGHARGDPQYLPREGQPPHQEQDVSPQPQQPHLSQHHEHAENGAFPEHIPGFIFVTSGHSSAIQTAALSKSTSSPQTKSLYYDDSDDGENDEESPRNVWVYGRIAVICLLIAVLVAAILLAVLFSQQNESIPSSAQAVGAEPSFAPLPPILTPTFSSTPAPSNINRQPPAPSSGEDVTNTPSQVESVRPNSPSNSRPSHAPNLRPTILGKPTVTPSPPATQEVTSPTMPSVAERLEALSPDSMTAWLDPTSPQAMALDWLIEDPKGTSYSDLKLMQRFALATLFFGTDGSGWTNPLSWVVESLDECEWRGIECNDNGGVKIIKLSDENLSGQLPDEIQLLSETLEEFYLSSNQITGTFPSSMGRLSNLSRMQLTENQLTGTIPKDVGNLSNVQVLSFKSNKIGGTLPSELGQLKQIRTFDISRNAITGTIPAEFGNMDAIESLYLSGNLLTGTIPSTLVQLPLLSTLTVSKNDLAGEMPAGLCGMDELTADCVDEIECAPGCCTTCCVDDGDCFANTVKPTRRPTLPPTATPSPTQEVTEAITPTTPPKQESSETMTPTTPPKQEGSETMTPTTPPKQEGSETMTPTTPPKQEDSETMTPTTPPKQEGSETMTPTSFPTPLDTEEATPTGFPTPGDTEVATPTSLPTEEGTEAATSSPTQEGTSAVTGFPTPEGTDGNNLGTTEPTPFGSACTTSIATAKTCYENGEDIEISFQNCNPTPFDWIGVYPARTDDSNLGEPVAWLWACGDQFCNEAVDAGEVTIFNTRGSGTFRVYLLSSHQTSTGPFSPHAVGNTFTMATSCNT